MSNIVVGVRLNADGSGLVGQLKLSGAEMDKLRASEKGAADAARDLSQATEQASKAQSRVAQGARQAQGAVDGLTRNVGLQRAGWQQVGFQMQDVFASYASGSRLSVIFAQQSGQLASAIALIAQSAEGSKGKLGGLASFLGGPWGIAIGVGVSVVGALAASLTAAGSAADVAKAGASGLADAQSVLGDIFDLTTGKIKSQNDLLILNARLMAINLRSEAAQQKASASSTIQASDDRSLLGGASAFFARTAQNPFARVAQMGERADTARSYLDAIGNSKNESERRSAGQRALEFSESADFSGLSITAEEFRQAVIDQASSVAKSAIADAIDKSLDTGALDPTIRRDDRTKPKKDNSAAKAAKEAERLATFSDRAAEAVARLSSEYDTAPRDIDRAGAATRSLDAIIGDVNQRLTTSKHLTAGQRAEFEKIKGEAEALKPVIQESLVRPFTDMLASQQRQIELGKLQVAGRQADGEALQVTYALMDKMGVESEDQLAAELAKRGVTEDQVRALYGNLEVLRQQTQEMRVQQQIQQMFLSAVGDMRENVRLTLQDLRQEGPKALGDFAKRSLDVFDRLFSEVATEKLFGGLFRDLEDQITGGDKISKAGDKLAVAVGKASGDIKQTSGDILNLGKAAAAATSMISGAASGGIVGDDGAAVDPDFADITVTAPEIGFKEGFEGVFDDLKGDLKTLFTDIFGDKGLFSKSLGETMGRIAGYGALGGMAGGLATGAFGVRGSGTGGMVGGAIGGAAVEELFSKTLGSFAGPIGSIAGGIVGSVVGGLLKKTKSGAATITSVDGDATLSGNSSSFKEAASGAADNVQDGLAQIASTLGGAIGAFNVTIGQRHGDWRVREGAGSLKIKKGATEFDDDQAGAIAYAIQLAVSQGAVTGLSAAIDQALRSSPDINEALEEALKVQEVEQMLGGLGSEMAKQFKAFEMQAKERLRIATQYGFDVVAIEARNAEDRADLVNQILTDRVGSLQALLDDFKFGNLAEGSVMDQRNALLAQIAATRADAEAGKDGAADKLASLTRSLVELSRDSLGTAGSEYAADRTTAIDAAEAVIQAENERIKAAQGEQATTNAKLDEANTLATQQVDYLADILQALTAQGGGSSGGGTSGVGGSSMVSDWYRTQEL